MSLREWKNRLSRLWPPSLFWSTPKAKKSFQESSRILKAKDANLSLEFRVREFYFLFDDGEPHLLTPFLKKGFSHCFLVERLDFVYMMYNPTRHGLDVFMPPCEANVPFVENMMHLQPSLKAIRIKAKSKGDIITWPPRFISCVSMLQYITGMPFKGCFTPYQLFNRLQKSCDWIEEMEVVHVKR